MKWPGTLLVLAVVFRVSSGYKILGINASPSRSHVIVQDALMKELARRGHEVTMVSPYPEKEQLQNYRKITVPISDWAKTTNDFYQDQSKLAMMKQLQVIVKLSMDATNDTLNHPSVQKIIREESFDLLVTGIMADFVLGLTTALNCPSVVVSPNAALSLLNEKVGNPSPLATIPNPMVGMANSRMTFLERVKNILGFVFEEIFRLVFAYYSKQYYITNFPSPEYPPYEAAQRNVSLILLNHHFTKGTPRPYVPTMIEVGGLQIKEKPSPLPQDIQQWIDGAKDGVILFSMGTNLMTSLTPPEQLKALLSTFGKLKQRIIWKSDLEDLPGKPANVLLRSWLPQDDILAHKNVKLFVMHGGLGGVAEALYHAVPLVGIPMFGDQQANLARVENEGWAYVVPFKALNEASLTHAIREVLDNPSYKENVNTLSQLFRDRPQSAMETAVFWTEYVIRHRGAPHMRYAGVDMNFLQLYSLDVIAFLLAAFYVGGKVLSFTCRRVFCGRSSSKLKKQ